VYFELQMLQLFPLTKYPLSHVKALVGLQVIEFVNLDGHVWQVLFSKKYPESQEEQAEGLQRLQPTNLLAQVKHVLFSRK